jgi:hypothetical protein
MYLNFATLDVVILSCMQLKVWFLLFLKHDFQYDTIKTFQTMFAKSKNQTF